MFSPVFVLFRTLCFYLLSLLQNSPVSLGFADCFAFCQCSIFVLHLPCRSFLLHVYFPRSSLSVSFAFVFGTSNIAQLLAVVAVVGSNLVGYSFLAEWEKVVGEKPKGSCWISGKRQLYLVGGRGFPPKYGGRRLNVFFRLEYIS